jgi:acetyl esterase/lipase
MKSRAIGITCASILIMLIGASPAGAQDAGVSIQTGILYATHAATDLRMDAYLPSSAGQHPAVLVILGERDAEDEKIDSTDLTVDLANRGFAVFVVSYRSLSDSPFPAPLEDIQSAVRFVRDHADRFGVDPERIGALGAAEGGYLAALLGTWGEGSTMIGARIRATVSLFGAMDLTSMLDEGQADLVEVVRTMTGCSADEDCRAEARLASPLTHVDPTDGAFFLVSATDGTVPEDQATEMAERLESLDLPNQVFSPGGGRHGLEIVQSSKGFEPIVSFLSQWLSDGPADPDSTSTPGSKGESTGLAPGGGATSTSPLDDARPARARVVLPTWIVLALVGALILAVASVLATATVLRSVRKRDAPTSTLGEGIAEPISSRESLDEGSDRFVRSE